MIERWQRTIAEPRPTRSTRVRARAGLAVALLLAVLAAACTGGGEPDEAATAIGAPVPGDDTATGDDGWAADGSADRPEVALAARPGPFQLSIDSPPDSSDSGASSSDSSDSSGASSSDSGASSATIIVRTVDGEPLAEAGFDDAGTALIRGLPAGPVEVAISDGRGGGERPAGRWMIPGEEPPSGFDYAGAALQAGFNYLPTRDGTTLSAFVTLPGSANDGPYPTLVEYSGYSPSDPTASSDPNRILIPSLGYALVQVNVRGTGCSGGSFDTFERIQSLDGYDVIETVAAQPWSAKVGMFGISYPGIMQLHVASTRPPSLAAIAPLSVLDQVGSVLYPGGIYNNGFAETWTRQVGERAEAGGQEWAAERIRRGDLSCEENQRFRGHNPDLVELIRNSPYADELSAERSAETWADRIEVPTFVAGAWQDEQTGPRFPALFDELADTPGFRAVVYNGLHADPVGPETLTELIAFYHLYVGERSPTLDPITAVLIQVGLSSIFGEAVEMPVGRYADLDRAEGLERFESDPPIRVLFEQGGDAPNLPVPTFDARFSHWPPTEVAPTAFHLVAGNGGIPTLAATEPTSAATFGFVTDPDEGARTTIDDPRPDLDHGTGLGLAGQRRNQRRGGRLRTVHRRCGDGRQPVGRSLGLAARRNRRRSRGDDLRRRPRRLRDLRPVGLAPALPAGPGRRRDRGPARAVDAGAGGGPVGAGPAGGGPDRGDAIRPRVPRRKPAATHDRHPRRLEATVAIRRRRRPDRGGHPHRTRPPEPDTGPGRARHRRAGRSSGLRSTTGPTLPTRLMLRRGHTPDCRSG